MSKSVGEYMSNSGKTTVADKIKTLQAYPQDEVICAIIWTKEDVIERAHFFDPTSFVTEDEAAFVLKEIVKNHDANLGVNLDIIDHHTEKVFDARKQYISELNRDNNGEIMFQDMWFSPPIRWVLSTRSPVGWEAYRNEAPSPVFLLRTDKITFPHNGDIVAARRAYADTTQLKYGDTAVLTQRVEYADGALFGEEGDLVEIVTVFKDRYSVDRKGETSELLSTVSVFPHEVKLYTD